MASPQFTYRNLIWERYTSLRRGIERASVYHTIKWTNSLSAIII